ncbi:extracellular solute-binding protein [Aestuariicella hydrocarbonica]|uniref:Putrescine-binding periplasmic protein n=1 Tax=Pseudomaricurvus hydrocarbonicus TaxID=1470433 RepID=A0A9E5JQ36_9GAMM|nr:extracellular solute-binding protein [Aestuariicella hydrocarbonica]NHO64542.1 extracellular solute-binding protein [Aestuariicella hydrocarbonica]
MWLKRLSWVVLLSLGTVWVQADEPPILNVYNWTDYITDDVLDQFERETGIKVNYHTYESNDELNRAIASNSTEMDVIGPSGEFLPFHEEKGSLLRLDKSLLPNLANLEPTLQDKMSTYDPGNQYAIPYLWGSVGIGYNVKKIRAKLGDETALATWGSFFDPEFMAQFANCGINLLGSQEDIFDISLKYLGYDPQQHKRAYHYQVANLLAKIRPYISSFDSSDYIDDLASGKICVTLAWSGDVDLARERARELNSKVELKYVTPNEGTALWIDTMAISAKAKHPGNAHQFLNFLMRPDVIADISNYARYANANQKATALVDASMRNDPNIYMSDANMENTWLSYTPDKETLELREKIWSRLVVDRFSD